MSDQDRGPYAPQTEAPLAFDARQARGGGGGPAPLTLLVSAIILMALIVGILLFYRHGVRHPDQTPTLVGAPVAQTKAAPPSGDTTASDQAAGLQVYNSEATPSSEGRPPPAFQGGEEQPAPLPAARPVQPPPAIVNAPLRSASKPAPPPPAHAPTKPVTIARLPLAPPPVVSAPPSDSGNVAGSAFGQHGVQASHAASSAAHSSAPPSAAAAAHSSAPPAKSTTVAANSSVAPKAADSSAKPKPKTPPIAAAPEPKPAAASPAGGVTVQIGAFSSADLAKQGWTDTAHVLPGAMAGKSRKVESTVKDGKTFYRSYVGGFASKADAEAFCTSLRARSRPCMVK